MHNKFSNFTFYECNYDVVIKIFKVFIILQAPTEENIKESIILAPDLIKMAFPHFCLSREILSFFPIFIFIRLFIYISRRKNARFMQIIDNSLGVVKKLIIKINILLFSNVPALGRCVSQQRALNLSALRLS